VRGVPATVSASPSRSPETTTAPHPGVPFGGGAASTEGAAASTGSGSPLTTGVAEPPGDAEGAGSLEQPSAHTETPTSAASP